MVSEAMVKSNKQKSKYSKGGKTKRAANVLARHMEGKVKMDRKMKKMFRKRARDYNSDDNDDDNELQNTNVKRPSFENEVLDGNSSGEEEANASDDEEEMSGSEDEGHESQSGITKFIGGCRAFGIAFKTITKKNISDDLLGPVLSEHKKLVAEKLAEEAELKVKGEARKERPLLREKGHVKPANFLDSHEKFLISVATKGVVKLFNAVNKAQNAQKGLNPSRSKDAKVLAKRRKEAFLAELHKKPTQAAEILSKGINLGGTENDDGPSWAPLRDSYMLTSSKLKNWDKMQETNVAPAMEEMPHYSSSDED